MSIVHQPEVTKEKEGTRRAERGEAPATPQAKSAPGKWGFEGLAHPRAEVLCALGENVEEYIQITESLTEDLQPRPGYETQLVEQMGETIWEMGRIRRMREGLALKRIQNRILSAEATAATYASNAFDNLEPFERLQEALNRRGSLPTTEEIADFAKSRAKDTSERTKEFINLLTSLLRPMEESEQKSALRRARAELRALMQGYETAAWRMGRRLEKVHSPEGLAALMAPEGNEAKLLQRMEESTLRRLWRLTNTLGRVRKGLLDKKDVNDDATGRYVIENKGCKDKMPEEKADISA